MREEEQQKQIIEGHEDITRAIRDLREVIVSLDSKLTGHIIADEEVQTKIVAHMKEVQPYLQGVAGLGVLSKVFYALGGLAILWLAIRGVFFHG